MLYTGDSLVSHLETEWCWPGGFQSALHLCHIGETAGAIMSVGQRCLGVYPTGPPWWDNRLVLSRGLGLTETVDW